MADPADFAFASVRTIGAAYRDGSLSPVAYAKACLARLEALEPRLNAVITPMRDLALATAQSAEAELASGKDRGPLHGIPVAIKDLIDIRGIPTTYATKAVVPTMPTRDADLVGRLLRAGAVLLGKTNLLEFAYGIAHPVIGQTNNPFDTGRTSGGSSGGSAALVSAGIVPLSVGTDTGGSIRIPAAYCGIVGLKPTYGLVPTEGVFPLSWSLDHAGPLARSASDAALLLAALSGKPMPVLPCKLHGLRIGVLTPHMDSPLVIPGVRMSVQAALDRLIAEGAATMPMSFAEHDAVGHGLMTVLLPEASLIHEKILKANPDGYAPGTRAQVEAGFAIPGVEYVRAQRLRGRLTGAVEALFRSVDVLISPAVSFVAPAEDPALEGEGGDAEGLSSGIANMTGHPAVSIPCGLSEGLPVGMQLMGPLGCDDRLLSIAAAIETALGFSARPAL